jgi:prolipoprotein diacylglyceryltransferase
LTPKAQDEGTEEVLSENILRIADELVRQVDLAKKLVAVMLVALIVGVPVGWHLAGALSGSKDSFMVIGYATILIAVAFVVVGVRQWMVLSKWTERYKAYQELQKKIDAKLDFEDQPGGVD